jgi:hypothetical protein
MLSGGKMESSGYSGTGLSDKEIAFLEKFARIRRYRRVGVLSIMGISFAGLMNLAASSFKPCPDTYILAGILCFSVALFMWLDLRKTNKFRFITIMRTC